MTNYNEALIPTAERISFNSLVNISAGGRENPLTINAARTTMTFLQQAEAMHAEGLLPDDEFVRLHRKVESQFLRDEFQGINALTLLHTDPKARELLRQTTLQITDKSGLTTEMTKDGKPIEFVEESVDAQIDTFLSQFPLEQVQKRNEHRLPSKGTQTQPDGQTVLQLQPETGTNGALGNFSLLNLDPAQPATGRRVESQASPNPEEKDDLAKHLSSSNAALIGIYGAAMFLSLVTTFTNMQGLAAGSGFDVSKINAINATLGVMINGVELAGLIGLYKLLPPVTIDRFRDSLDNLKATPLKNLIFKGIGIGALAIVLALVFKADVNYTKQWLEPYVQGASPELLSIFAGLASIAPEFILQSVQSRSGGFLGAFGRLIGSAKNIFSDGSQLFRDTFHGHAQDNTTAPSRPEGSVGNVRVVVGREQAQTNVTNQNPILNLFTGPTAQNPENLPALRSRIISTLTTQKAINNPLLKDEDLSTLSAGTPESDARLADLYTKIKKA